MITISGEGSVLLPEGHYWIELDFERPIMRETLLDALRQMGFERVVFEPENSRIGALGSSSLSSATRTAPVPVSTSTAAATKVATAAAVSAPAPVKVSTSVAPVATRSPIAPSAPLPSPTPVAPVKASTSLSPLTTATPKATAAPAPTPSYATHGPGLQGLGGGSSSPAPSPATPPAQAYAPELAPEPSPAGGGGGGGGGGGSFEDAALSPVPGAPAPPADDFRATPASAATASPLATQTPPAKSSSFLPWALLGGAAAVAAAVAFAGEVSENPFAFRLTAKLSSPLSIRNLPGMWWKAVHLLAIDPSSGIRFNLEPHRLETGRTYDLRFLARDKTAVRRADVVALLTAMGFAPADALLVKRNIRIPGRAGTSVSEWMGVGTWTKAASYTTMEDPFAFVDVVPVVS